MIKAKHNWFIKSFLDWYIPNLVTKNFGNIKCFGEWKDNGKASMVIGNHVSWWDGFWVFYLNSVFLKKKFHLMMLEEQLKIRKMFSKAGAYSINPGSKTVIESLNYTNELLNINENLVLIYPQGEISSIMKNTVDFQKGVERIIRKSKDLQLLFYVAFVDYLSSKKPTLYFYVTEIEFKKYSLKELQEEYQEFYNKSLIKQASLKE